MDSDDNDALDFDGNDAEVDMNTSLSRDLHRWADEERDGLKRCRLRAAAVRASNLEQELDQATRAATFPSTTKETLPLHLVKSLEMLGPKEAE